MTAIGNPTILDTKPSLAEVDRKMQALMDEHSWLKEIRRALVRDDRRKTGAAAVRAAFRQNSETTSI